MTKLKYVKEFEMQASPKILFPYISTVSGLEAWFAKEIRFSPPKKYTFIWEDKREYPAVMTVIRNNRQVKFEFASDENDLEKPSFFELRLEHNEMTNSTFVKVIDFSDMDDEAELDDLWEGFIDNLKEVVGG